MTSPLDPVSPLSRRRLLGLGASAGSSLLLGGCALNGLSEQVGQISEPLNQRLEVLLQGRGPVPEFRPDQVDPEALLINSFNGTPRLDPGSYRLRVEGLVNRPLQLDLAVLAALPQHSITMRHVCVEGWAAIVVWSGVRLADVLHLAGISPLGGYVEIESADQYFESWDLPSAFHPQTLLATPIKLGYKLSKWVTRLRVVSSLGVRRGTWEDQGYLWFAGP